MQERGALLRPYVPRLVIDWLAEEPGRGHRRVDGTFVFADISGFTALTEKLGRTGKVGAEEMGELLNDTFDQLLSPAYEYGAGLLKWGGDAVLLLFQGERHARRAAKASLLMQATMRRIGRVHSSVGWVRLRMSIGIHSGDIDLFVAGTRWRELIVTGPAATTVVGMEALADAGEVLVSPSTAEQLPPSCVRVDEQGRKLLIRAPRVTPDPSPIASRSRDKLLPLALPRPVAHHIVNGNAAPEHKLVSTVFVRFGGCDALIEEHGPEALVAPLTGLVDAVEEIADEYDVTALATDVGKDGGKVVLVSGAPATSGDIEDRALCAARAIVDRATLLPLAAGVTRGRVFTGDFGPAHRRTYSVVGDSVNLAARLMARAASGQVIAHADVIQATRAGFSTTRLEPFAVKGKSELIDAFSVDALPASQAVDASVSLPDEGPFIGRDSDLVALWDRWDAVNAGEGRVVEIVGDGGMGKSRLVAEWRQRSQATVHAAGCDVYTAARPYWPIGQLLRSAIALPEFNGDDALEWLTAVVRDRAPEKLELLPLVGSILGTPQPMSGALLGMDERLRRQRIADLVVLALDACLPGPTTLIVGDLHNADQASVDLLRLIVASVPIRKWLLLVTRRSDGPSVLADIDPHSTSLWLAPLSQPEATTLVERLTEDEPLTPYETRGIVAQSGGNPMFLSELVAARRGAGPGELPDTVEIAIGRRIDRLPAAERTALRTLAVLGIRSDDRLADRVLDRSGSRLSGGGWRRLDGFVRRQQGQVVFSQAIVRDVAYEGIPFAKRRRLHAMAADVVEELARPDEFVDGILSIHLESAHQFDRASAAALAAGDRARESFAHAEAKQFYDRALRSAGKVPELADTMSSIAWKLGMVSQVLGIIDDAVAAFGLAKRRATSPAQLARSLQGLADCGVKRGDYRSVIRQVDRGVRLLPDVVDPHERRAIEAALLIDAAGSWLMLGRAAKAIEMANRAIAAASADASDLLQLAEAHRVRAMASRLLDTPESLAQVAADLDTSLALMERVDQPRLRARVLNTLGFEAYLRGDWNQARGHYQRAHEDLLRSGDEWSAAIVDCNLVEILTDQGHWQEAVERIRNPLRVLRASKTPSQVGFATTLLGLALGRSGQLDQGTAMLATAEEFYRDCQEQAGIDGVVVRQIELRLLAGDAQLAHDAADELIADADRSHPWLPVLLRAKGIALAMLGRPAAGVEQLRLALAAARQSGARHEVAFALHALQQVLPMIGAEHATVAGECSDLFASLGIVAVAWPAIPERRARRTGSTVA